MEKLFNTITLSIGVLIGLCFLYQAVYVVIGLLIKPKKFEEKKRHRFAVLISARNESSVIKNLIRSIQTQTYPKELVDIFVIADNCNDDTALLARKAGALVYERFHQSKVGKGYALNYLLQQIDRDYGIEAYDGYLILDADNILEKDYIEQINKVFDNGYRVVTSYRNSKNYGSNWISAGYALWFLREARFVNNVRMILGVSCAVSGTGFLVHRDILKKNRGWNCFLLTEDIQFSVESILKGEKIGYCDKAILYDEQPTNFKDSWNQRLRWSKGFYQVFFRYGKNLASGMIKKRSFSCYDMFITIMPGIGLSLITALFGLLSLFLSVINLEALIFLFGKTLFLSLINSYLMFFLLGFLTTLKEHKQIYCKTWKKWIYLLTFPIFMYTYIPISIAALFQKPDWKPIRHSVVVTAKEIRSQ